MTRASFGLVNEEATSLVWAGARRSGGCIGVGASSHRLLARLGVELDGSLLDLILQAAGDGVHHEREADEAEAIRRVRRARLGLALAEVERDDAAGDDDDLQVLEEAVLLAAEDDAARHHGHHLARLAQHLRRVRDVAQRLVRAGHREHLRDARVEDVHERDFEPGAAEAHDARQADRRVDAALAHQREEGVREVLAVVRLLVDVLLQHGKVAEREEDAGARDGELDLGGQLGHSHGCVWCRYVARRRSELEIVNS